LVPYSNGSGSHCIFGTHKVFEDSECIQEVSMIIQNDDFFTMRTVECLLIKQTCLMTLTLDRTLSSTVFRVCIWSKQLCDREYRISEQYGSVLPIFPSSVGAVVVEVVVDEYVPIFVRHLRFAVPRLKTPEMHNHARSLAESLAY
jgi:hypothetical protein